MFSFWLGMFRVVYPKINGLVPSPARFETGQFIPSSVFFLLLCRRCDRRCPDGDTACYNHNKVQRYSLWTFKMRSNDPPYRIFSYRIVTYGKGLFATILRHVTYQVWQTFQGIKYRLEILVGVHPNFFLLLLFPVNTYSIWPPNLDWMCHSWHVCFRRYKIHTRFFMASMEVMCSLGRAAMMTSVHVYGSQIVLAICSDKSSDFSRERESVVCFSLKPCWFW